ncbi:interleukin-8-like [Oryzias latipes]|uniref:Chemokine interleukin-8-like domain-containing protein n=2 Tax=Oryzias latipes TaxID=8090 RepID=A0A3B3IPA3_ORYLA|nr:interleukin-8-like [Oryzias latipes]
MFPTVFVTLLVVLKLQEGTGVGVQGINLRCQCITKEKTPIGRLIGAVEVNPASSHCKEVEIIATFAKNGKKICLDPEAPWVKKVVNAMRKLPGWTP